MFAAFGVEVVLSISRISNVRHFSQNTIPCTGIAKSYFQLTSALSLACFLGLRHENNNMTDVDMQ